MSFSSEILDKKKRQEKKEEILIQVRENKVPFVIGQKVLKLKDFHTILSKGDCRLCYQWGRLTARNGCIIK